MLHARLSYCDDPRTGSIEFGPAVGMGNRKTISGSLPQPKRGLMIDRAIITTIEVVIMVMRVAQELMSASSGMVPIPWKLILSYQNMSEITKQCYTL